MNTFVRLVKRLIELAQQHIYLSVIVAIITVLLIGGIVYGVASSRKTQSVVLDATTSQRQKESAAANSTDRTDAGAAASNSAAAQPGASASQPGAEAQDGANPVAKSLLVSPSTVTVVRGENPVVTMKSSNGVAVNMPNFSTSTEGRFLVNFAAAPAKPSWTGPIMVRPTASPGTYVLDVFAQDNSTAFYRGTLTIVIVEPTMTIAIQPEGYDSESDMVTYRITINRLYGFSEEVTSLSVYNTTEPGLGCIYGVVDPGTVMLSCGHDDGVRPTAGTLTVSVMTASVSREATAAYSLPVLP